MQTKQINRIRRHRRVRARVKGTNSRPRLSVFRSNRQLFMQLIDDANGKTLISVSTLKMVGKNRMEKIAAASKLLADQALKLKINAAVFDRGGNKYHGQVKAAAEAVRNGGIKI